jgi:ElaB/YqjD/DUF883 family membrane-anchored ribosome-binding protein
MSQHDANDNYGPESLGGSAANEDRLKAARDSINAAFETAREKSSQACEQAEAYIRNSPMEAVGYAAGIGAILGLVVGMLMGRAMDQR